MILSYQVPCKCRHPLSWHMWFPENVAEWPIDRCLVEDCDCKEFTITFRWWLTFTLFRKVSDVREEVKARYKRWKEINPYWRY